MIYNRRAVTVAVIYNGYVVYLCWSWAGCSEEERVLNAHAVAVIYNGYAVYLCWSCAGCSEEERVLILVSWDPVEVGENPEKDTGPESTQSQNISLNISD